MALGNAIQLRLSPEKQLAYEDEAERLGKPLATYLRERLELGDGVRGEIAALRHEMGVDLAALRHAVEGVKIGTASNGASAARGEPPSNAGPMLELLLLLRVLVPPDRMAMVHAELRRLGVEVWTYKTGKP